MLRPKCLAEIVAHGKRPCQWPRHFSRKKDWIGTGNQAAIELTSRPGSFYDSPAMMLSTIPKKSTRQISGPLRVFAFALVLVLLTVRIGSYTTEVFVTPLQDYISDIAFINQDNSGADAKPNVFKPKRAFDFFFLEGRGLLTFLPSPIEMLAPCIPFRAFPEVYLDIFVPPESLS